MKQTRRDFLKTTAVSAGVLAVGSRQKVLGANDRINVGIIGVGGMGRGHLRALHERSDEYGCRVVAVCDVYQRRIAPDATETQLVAMGRRAILVTMCIGIACGHLGPLHLAQVGGLEPHPLRDLPHRKAPIPFQQSLATLPDVLTECLAHVCTI